MEPSLGQSALPEFERRFRSVFAHAAIGVAIIDAGARFIFVNQALCEMSGYGEQELCGMQFTQLLHPDDRALRLDVFRQILEGSLGSYIYERRLLRKDGTLMWVRTSVTVPSEPAVVAEVFLVVEDITQRKEAEDALRASEERFRIASDNASDMIYEWDLRTGEVGVFGPAHQYMGDWPTPRSYDAWKKMVHPEDLELVPPDLARFIQSGERYSGEYRIVGRSGKIYHYSNRGQSVRNAAGEPYKWIGLTTDITEAKLAEEAISQLAAIVQSSESAIMATDTAGAIATWNHGAETLLGYTAREALALSISRVIVVGRPGLRDSRADPGRPVLAAGRGALPAPRREWSSGSAEYFADPQAQRTAQRIGYRGARYQRSQAGGRRNRALGHA